MASSPPLKDIKDKMVKGMGGGGVKLVPNCKAVHCLGRRVLVKIMSSTKENKFS